MLRRLAVIAAVIALPVVIGLATVAIAARSDPPRLPELIHVGEDSPQKESGSQTSGTPPQTAQPPGSAPIEPPPADPVPPPADPVPPPPPVDDDDGAGDSGDD